MNIDVLHAITACTISAVATILFIALAQQYLYKWVYWTLAVFAICNAATVIVLGTLALVTYMLS